MELLREGLYDLFYEGKGSEVEIVDLFRTTYENDTSSKKDTTFRAVVKSVLGKATATNGFHNRVIALIKCFTDVGLHFLAWSCISAVSKDMNVVPTDFNAPSLCKMLCEELEIRRFQSSIFLRIVQFYRIKFRSIHLNDYIMYLIKTAKCSMDAVNLILYLNEFSDLERVIPTVLEAHEKSATTLIYGVVNKILYLNEFSDLEPGVVNNSSLRFEGNLDIRHFSIRQAEKFKRYKLALDLAQKFYLLNVYPHLRHLVQEETLKLACKRRMWDKAERTAVTNALQLVFIEELKKAHEFDQVNIYRKIFQLEHLVPEIDDAYIQKAIREARAEFIDFGLEMTDIMFCNTDELILEAEKDIFRRNTGKQLSTVVAG